MSKFAPVVLRIGVTLVFLWFGLEQVLDAETWTSLIPAWAANISGLSPYTLVMINGWFELIFGTLLLLGIYTRVTAFLLALHMIHITLVVGYNNIGVRDFGLSMATLAVFLHGPDTWCLEKFFRKNYGQV